MTIADRPPHRSVQARLRIRLLTKDAWRPHRQGEKKSAARAPGKSRTCATQFGNASPLKHIADQRRSSPAPRRRQVRKPHRRSRDSRPACVENPVESGHYPSTEQQFHDPMEVQVQPNHPRNSENDPGGNRCEEEESHKTYPNRSGPVKGSQSSICIAKGE